MIARKANKREPNFPLLPPKDGHCPECACVHPPENMHNWGATYYQNHFFNEHGRWPTWGDAFDHCTNAKKEQCRKYLLSQGVSLWDLKTSAEQEERNQTMEKALHPDPQKAPAERKKRFDVSE
jgi:hypothetical protein